MSPLLAPVLAQVLTLSVGDRTEARYVKYDDEIFEGTTTPGVRLALDWQRVSASLGYAPSFTLTPLEKKPRDLLVFHQAEASVGYHWPRTSLTLSTAFGYGEVNFRFGSLRNQPSPTGTPDGSGPPPTADDPAQGGTGAPAPALPGPTQPDPTDPSTGQLIIEDVSVRYYTSTSTVSLTRSLSKELEAEAHVGHMRAGGIGSSARLDYPPLSSWFTGLSATYTYVLSRRNAFLTTGSLEQSWSSYGSTTTTLMLSEGWQHTFNARTSASLSAGLSVTRFAEDSGLEGFSVFPTFQAAIMHQIPIERGSLSLGLFGYSSPALDPLRALVDPRVGVGGMVMYTRKRLSVGVDGGAAVSLAPADHNEGAISSGQAQAVVTYRITDFMAIDGGWRYSRQAVQGVTVIPSSWAAFVGLTLGYQVPLLGGRR